MLERGPVRKIAPEEEKNRELRRQVSHGLLEEKIVGFDVLAELRHAEGGIENEYVQKKLREARTQISKMNDPLHAIPGWTSRERFVLQAMRDPELARELIDLIGYTHEVYDEDDIPASEMTPEDLEEETRDITVSRVVESLRFNDPDKSEFIPDALFLRMLEAHVEAFRKKHEVFNREMEPIKANALARIERMIERRGLSLDSATITERLEGIAIKLVDDLHPTLEPDVDGAFSMAESAIMIKERRYKEAGSGGARVLEQIVVHELLHALSGATVVERETIFFGDTYQDPEFQRLGLQFNMPRERFRWLNEAVTQELTLDAVGAEGADSGIYKKERELLSKIITGSRDPEALRRLLYAAYFEYYRPKQGETRIPAWKALQEALAESFGPRFLTELDKAMRATEGKSADRLARGMAFVDERKLPQ